MISTKDTLGTNQTPVCKKSLLLLFVHTTRPFLIPRRMMSCLLALGGYRGAWNVDLFLMAMSSASDWRSLGRFVVHAQVFGVPFHMGRVALLPISAYACALSGGSVLF